MKEGGKEGKMLVSSIRRRERQNVCAGKTENEEDEGRREGVWEVWRWE